LGNLAASSSERKGRGERGEPGLYRGRHWWPVKAPVTPGSNAGERYWEGERGSDDGGDDRWVRAVGEIGGELGWVGSGQVGPAGLPGSAQLGFWPLLLFFFLCFPFSFNSEICFGYLKRLLYSDLNKSQADHFWSFKGVFRN
jgi:hypothetical protein